MVDVANLLSLIRSDMLALKEGLTQAGKQAQRLDPQSCRQDGYFLTGIQRAAGAARDLEAKLSLLSDANPTKDTKAAVAFIRSLNNNINDFRAHPDWMKDSGLSNFNLLVSTMQNIDPAFRRVVEQDVRATGPIVKSSDERRQLFLRNWRDQYGLRRMNDILRTFIDLKKLVIENTTLLEMNKLNISNQARSNHGLTQKELGDSFVSQVKQLYEKVLEPCLEGHISVFSGGKMGSLIGARFTRSCPELTRTVFLDGKPLADPIALMASDLCCVTSAGIFDNGADSMMLSLIKSVHNAPFMVIAFGHLKAFIIDLARILPDDARELSSMLKNWFAEDTNRFATIGDKLMKQYPDAFFRSTKENYLRGL